jgi:hypothetical protein
MSNAPLPHKSPTMKSGDGNEVRTGVASRLGVVKDAVAGGNGGPACDACKYCGEVDGHTAQCPVVSHHLGILARWTCDGCTAAQFTGRFPCRFCCGYTASKDKVVRGVLTAHGRLNARCPR